MQRASQTSPIAGRRDKPITVLRAPGGAHVQLLLPQPLRTDKPQTVWVHFKSFVYRTTNAVAPEGVRTPEKRRQSSKDTHQAVEGFLAALAAGALEPQDIEKHLARIGRACRPLTASTPALVTQAFKQCLQEQLHTLPIENLKRLRQQIEHAPDGPHSAFLKRIGLLARSACVERLRADVVDGTFTHVPKAQPLVKRILLTFNKTLQTPSEFSYAGHDAIHLLRHYGLLTTASHAKKVTKEEMKAQAAQEMAQGLAFLKELCTLFAMRGELNQAELFQLFQAIPPELQAQMSQAGHRLLPEDIPSDDNLLLNEAIQARRHQLEQSLGSACHQCLRSLSSNDPLPEQAAQLAALAGTWSALKAHWKGHGEAPRATTDNAVGIVCSKAASTLDLSNLGTDALTHAQLLTLKQTLVSLGIAHDDQAFAAEIARRKMASTLPYTTQAKRALQYLSAGRLGKGLKCLKDAHALALAAMRVHAELGDTFDSAEAHRAFYGQLFTEVFNNAAPNERQQWFNAVDQPQVQRLATVLTGIGQDRLDQGADLTELGASLGSIRLVFGERLNVQLPEPDFFHIKHDVFLLDPLTQAVGDALSNGGVSALKAASRRTLAPNTLQAMGLAVSALSAARSKPGVPNPLLDAAIDTDMKNTTYFIRREGQADQALAGSAALREALNPTDAQLASLALLAGTDLWSPVNQALASSGHTPIRLNDGSPLQLQDPLTLTSCHIDRDSDGRLSLRIERVLSQPQGAKNLNNGQPTPIHPDSQLHLSITLAIGPDGAIAVTQPLSSYQAIERAEA